MNKQAIQKSWSDYIVPIGEKIIQKKAVEDAEWRAAYRAANTFGKCFDGHHWSISINRADWAAKFYAKTIQLARTFFHKKKLALLAKQKEDVATLNTCIDEMVQMVLALNIFPTRSTYLLRLMDPSDPRRPAIQAHYARIKPRSKPRS